MKDTQFVPIPRLLWIMLQWTWEYCLSLRQWFHFLWLYIQKWDNGSHNSSLLNFFRNVHSIFPWNLHWCTSLPTEHEHSFFSTSSTSFVISYIFGTSHSNRHEVISLLLYICIPFDISNAEHLFIYLLTIYMSYLWENVYSLKM